MRGSITLDAMQRFARGCASLGAASQKRKFLRFWYPRRCLRFCETAMRITEDSIKRKTDEFIGLGYQLHIADTEFP